MALEGATSPVAAQMVPKDSRTRVPMVRRQKKRRRVLGMTVGAAIIAEKKQAIVLVADRLWTDENDYSGESDENKKRELGHGWHCLFEGSWTVANIASRLIRAELKKRKDDGPLSAGVIEDIVQRVVIRMRKDAAARAGKKASTFELDLGLLVAGFDEGNDAFVFEVDGNGEVEEEVPSGYGQIGTGAVAAYHRLLRLKPRKQDTLARAIYNAVDAKHHAEGSRSVGARTDVWVMTAHMRQQRVPLSTKIRVQPRKVPLGLVRDIRLAARALNRSAFDTSSTTKDKTLITPEQPPEDWRARLEGYAADVLAGPPSIA